MTEETQRDRDKRVREAERAVERAFSTGKADRAKITRMAQLDAAEAVALTGVAMESDAEADEAARLSLIASGMGDKEKARNARDRERSARDKSKADHKAATRAAKDAYEAIKFSDPTRIGFMRFVQVMFAIHIAVTILVLLLTSRDTVVYSSVNIIDWIMVVLEGVAFWFFINRYKIARPFGLGMSAFCVIASIASNLVTGSMTVLQTIASEIYYVFLVFYFWRSDRVKAVCVNDFSTDDGYYEKDDFVIDRSGWPFVRNLIIYFVIFSILGHWMEAGMCQFIRLGLVQGEYDPSNTMLWRDWFYPYAMEGAAVVFIALFLYPAYMAMKRRLPHTWMAYALSFVMNALLCSIIEFVSGLVFNANHQNWDYSDMPFNIMGQVCLQNAIAFGVAASLITWFVYPMMERMIARVRPAIMNIVCVVVGIIGALLFSLYAITPPESLDIGPGGKVDQEKVRTQQVEKLILDLVPLTTSTVQFSEDLAEADALTDTEQAQLDAAAKALQSTISAIAHIIDPSEEDATEPKVTTSLEDVHPDPKPKTSSRYNRTEEEEESEGYDEYTDDTYGYTDETYGYDDYTDTTGTDDGGYTDDYLEDVA